MRSAVILLLAACGSHGHGGSRTVTVTALAGDREEPGATVIGHAGNGDVIDQTTADAVGRAEVGVDDGALISVVFPGSISTITPVVSVITTPAPDDALVVHGPPHNTTPPLIVGVVQVDGPPLPAADRFEIQLGCATVLAQRLPANIDVGACSMGSDTKLDLIVRGTHDVATDPPTTIVEGYAAARVQMTDGVAQLAIAKWETAGMPVPVTQDGVAPNLELTVFSDQLPFATPPIIDHGEVWTGLVVDASRVTATLGVLDGARITTRDQAGAPTAIRFAAADFLPPISRTTARASDRPLHVTWDAASTGADAVHLHVTWQPSLVGIVPGNHRVVWDAVLPPDATGATLPVLDGDLGKTIAPTNIVPTDILLRYVDSSELDGFAALVAAGIRAEDTLAASTIAPRPTNGELRVTEAIGLP